MIPNDKKSPINQKKLVQEAFSKKHKISDFFGDFAERDAYYDWAFEKNPIKVNSVSRDDHDALHKSKKQVEERLYNAEDTLSQLTDGNEAMQRTLIEMNPSNIRYIKKPYVTIQLEAITADPSSFDLIKNPSQEAVDTYRMIK